MKTVKSFIKSIISVLLFLPDLLIWNMVYAKAKRTKNVKGSKGILLVPPADLNGSFGDELMVTSYIYNFADNNPVTILTQQIIERNDFLSGFKGLTFLGDFYKHRYGYMLQLLDGYSKVVVIGADVLDGSYSYYDSIKYLRLIRLAGALGIETAFSGFSVSKKTHPLLKREFGLVAESTFLKARDLETFKRLVTFAPESRVVQTSDMAFICPKLSDAVDENRLSQFIAWCLNIKSEGRVVIAICPNALQAEKIGYQEYINGMKTLIDTFSNIRKCAVAFLYHDVRVFGGGGSDKTISADLFDLYSGTDLPVYFDQNIKNGVELKSYFDYVDFTITGRMHFGISGIEAGKPMFGICYANKFEGMLQLFEIEPENSLVDYTALAACSEVVPLFLKHLDENSSKIARYLPRVKEQSLLNGTK